MIERVDATQPGHCESLSCLITVDEFEPKN
jgi:hypothetical protein